MKNSYKATLLKFCESIFLLCSIVAFPFYVTRYVSNIQITISIMWFQIKFPYLSDGQFNQNLVCWVPFDYYTKSYEAWSPKSLYLDLLDCSDTLQASWCHDSWRISKHFGHSSSSLVALGSGEILWWPISGGIEICLLELHTENDACCSQF